jgi:hypothetical protein
MKRRKRQCRLCIGFVRQQCECEVGCIRTRMRSNRSNEKIGLYSSGAESGIKSGSVSRHLTLQTDASGALKRTSCTHERAPV